MSNAFTNKNYALLAIFIYDMKAIILRKMIKLKYY